MNAQRRKEIADLIREAADPSELESFADRIDEIRDEEQDAFDNLPESLQGGERGDAMQEAIGNLEEAAEKMREAAQAVSDALDALDTAQE
jgi:hypothetical protein